jgi:hypothetical protein
MNLNAWQKGDRLFWSHSVASGDKPVKEGNRMQSLAERTYRLLSLVFTLALLANAQSAPTVDDAKRAINQRLQKIWKGLGTEGTRTVLFQDVLAGRGTPGHYPFRATLVVHDRDNGYPPNRYYGRTCVGKLEQETYILSMDDFGGWEAQGRMTPDLSTQTCKNNPAAGVSAIPLETLAGKPVGAGGTTPAPPRGGFQAASQTGGAMQGTKAPPAAGGAGVAVGSYECWANGQARLLLNFTALQGGRYRDSEGHTGSISMNQANGRVTFQGGNLDGFLPAGFYAVYYAPKGRPTVSFRNSGGNEIQFCEKQ